MKTSMIGAFVIVAMMAPLRAEQDPLGAARDFYASAAYEEALAALTQVTATAPDVARVVDQYRVSCLYALGRKTEGEHVAEEFIKREPLVELVDASPRIEAMFQEVRKRLLPALVREEYKAGRLAIDGKDPASAQLHLKAAARMVAEAEA